MLFVFLFSACILGESCNDQRYFPTHACIAISTGVSTILGCSVFEMKTVSNPQPSEMLVQIITRVTKQARSQGLSPFVISRREQANQQRCLFLIPPSQVKT